MLARVKDEYWQNRDEMLAKAKARYAAKPFEERRAYYWKNRDAILAKQRARYAEQHARSTYVSKKQPKAGPVVFWASTKTEPLI